MFVNIRIWNTYNYRTFSYRRYL